MSQVKTDTLDQSKVSVKLVHVCCHMLNGKKTNEKNISKNKDHAVKENFTPALSIFLPAANLVFSACTLAALAANISNAVQPTPRQILSRNHHLKTLFGQHL